MTLISLGKEKCIILNKFPKYETIFYEYTEFSFIAKLFFWFTCLIFRTVISCYAFFLIHKIFFLYFFFYICYYLYQAAWNRKLMFPLTRIMDETCWVYWMKRVFWIMEKSLCSIQKMLASVKLQKKQSFFKVILINCNIFFHIYKSLWVSYFPLTP